MDSAKKPAFPFTAEAMSTGLTKREYFAGQAIAGLSVDADLRYEQVAEYAVKIADAVLKRLEETNDAS